MLARLARAPKAMLLILFGVVFGMVWAAAGGPTTAAAPPPKGGVSITAGPGIVVSPTPLTSTGTISVDFPTVDTRYLRPTGGTMTGDLAFAGNAQLIAPRIENAALAPFGAAAGRLWFDTTELRLKLHDGVNWTPVPQIFSDQELPPVVISVPDVWHDLNCLATFTLPAEEAIFLDGGATGDLHNLISYGVVPPGIQTSNTVRMFVGASIDGGLVRTLTSWEATFLFVDSTPPQAHGSPATLLRLPAGTHTLRLVARTSGVVNPGSSPLPPEAFEGRLQDAWIRVHRP